MGCNCGQVQGPLEPAAPTVEFVVFNSDGGQVPFLDREDADAWAREHGGRLRVRAIR